eukprot:GFUD01102513.1.p1 GENE.GFUD01102513.1~~GFUD01102513.1.p1  ORF type:complete len:110 (+),score=17.93 GFUD01102513.1:49-378(+)
MGSIRRDAESEEESRPRIKVKEIKEEMISSHEISFPEPTKGFHPCLELLTTFNFYFPVAMFGFMIFWGSILYLLWAPPGVHQEYLPENVTVSISYEIVRKELLHHLTET